MIDWELDWTPNFPDPAAAQSASSTKVSSL
jgi:hypothetical protein